MMENELNSMKERNKNTKTDETSLIKTNSNVKGPTNHDHNYHIQHQEHKNTEENKILAIVSVPTHSVGRIIGKRGRQIKDIQYTLRCIQESMAIR